MRYVYMMYEIYVSMRYLLLLDGIVVVDDDSLSLGLEKLFRDLTKNEGKKIIFTFIFI